MGEIHQEEIAVFENKIQDKTKSVESGKRRNWEDCGKEGREMKDGAGEEDGMK